MEKYLSHIAKREKGIVFLKSFGITCVIMILIYRSIWAIVLFPIVWIFQIYQTKNKEKEERKAKLQEEFMHGLGVLNSSLQAGLSMENAWKEVEKETKFLYGDSSDFYMVMKEMNRKVAHNTPIEKLFLEFAYKSKVEEIIQFAELLEFGKRSGSNWKRIIEVTVNQMLERHEAKQQIEIMVAEKRMEQRIMNVVPLGLLAFLQVSAWDYMEVLYHNWLGGIAMTFFLIGYVIAIMLSQRILKVQV